MKYKTIELGEVYEEGDEWLIPKEYRRFWGVKYMPIPEDLIGTKKTKKQFNIKIRRKVN